MADNISLKCRHWTKNKPIEMVRLFKKVYNSHVAETIALEPHSNYLSLRILTNLKFTQGNVHPAGTLCRKWRKCLVCWRLAGPLQEQEMGINKFLCLWESSGRALYSRCWSSTFGATVVFYSGMENSQRIELEEICFVFLSLFMLFLFHFHINETFAQREKLPFLHNCSLSVACHLNI